MRGNLWGYNGSDELGLSHFTNETRPPTYGVYLGEGRGAVAISARLYHTCAKLDNNEMKCWGNNGSGQLGLGDNT